MQSRDLRVLPNFLGHSLLILAATCAFGWLFYHYFYGEYGKNSLTALQEQLSRQQYANQVQAQKLARLRADVHDLKSGLVAIEEHARTDLGLIKEGEVFVQMSSVQNYRPALPSSDNVEAQEVLEATDGEILDPQLYENLTHDDAHD